MSGVTELGYVRLGVSDLARWRDFAGRLVGLEVGADSTDERLFLRSDLWHHRLIVEQHPDDDLLGAGLRVAGPGEFAALQERLRAAGVAFDVADAATTAQRCVLELLTLVDPAGNPLEIFHGPRVDTHRPFHPGRGMFGKFVTGDGGLGHMMLRTGDLKTMHAFYTLLGMRGSIEYRVPIGADMTIEILFMHCNTRDHTLAFGLPSQRRINHIMFEVSELDDVFLAYNLLRDAGYEIAILPGKHANDQMFSFYCISPSGFQVEIGWGGRPASHQSEYYVGDTYGHEFTAGR
ncbi:MAG TPA: VOC family protein, partial [Polymorphobacter sp.]|nr:VOC family protein [Polymorphobacter sp.]